MNLFIFSSLLAITIVFYMLAISFKSFSRISLAGFLDDFENEKIKTFDFVEKHEMVLNALGGFSFFLQLVLFVSSIILLEQSIAGLIERVVLLILAFQNVAQLYLLRKPLIPPYHQRSWGCIDFISLSINFCNGGKSIFLNKVK